MFVLMLATIWNMYRKPQLIILGAATQYVSMVDQIKNSQFFQISPIFHFFFKVKAFFWTDNIFLTHNTWYISYLVMRKWKNGDYSDLEAILVEFWEISTWNGKYEKSQKPSLLRITGLLEVDTTYPRVNLPYSPPLGQIFATFLVQERCVLH